MARRIEAATGIETRATILGHMQRGGNPTCKDRVYASMMGALAVDLLKEGKSCRVVGYRHGEFMDFDINEALAMQKDVSPYMLSLIHIYISALVKFSDQTISHMCMKFNTVVVQMWIFF